jgi:hypothetical protein
MMTVSGLALAVATFIIAVALGAGARRVLGSDPLGRVEEGFLVLGFGWALMGWWGVVLAETRNFTPARTSPGRALSPGTTRP